MHTSTDSSWLRDHPLQLQYPPLSESLSTDVVIIGAGLTGITAAYFLAKAGKKVIVLEKNLVGSGMTSWTTAFLTQVIDASLTEMSRTFGSAKAKGVWESGQVAIDQIEKIIQNEGIKCDFMRVPAYVYAVDQTAAEKLQQEAEVAHSLGFQQASFFRDQKLPFHNFGYLKVENQAKFSPLDYLLVVTQRAQKLGVRIFEETEAIGFTSEKNGHEIVIETRTKNKIRAEFCIEASYTPVQSAPFLQLKLIATQTYVIESTLAQKFLEEGIYWDTNKPYSYFRVDAGPETDRVIFGGGDHLVGQAQNDHDYYAELEAGLKTLLPSQVSPSLVACWSGEIIETVDGLPYIGKKIGSSNHFIATGFSGNGMTYSMVAALLLTDLVTGQKNSWADIYSLQRLSGMMEVMKGSMNYPVQMMKRFFKKSEAKTELTPDSGAVVDENGKKVAIYKDKDGKITKLSAVCTHMGCIVGFNDSEKTWDCPCHGSRFAKDGAVINGPAKNPLPKIEE